jgi:5'-methylthioadenosine phosphorylase
MTTPPHFAVIGGSGLYDIPGLSDTQEHDIETPFGSPSAPILTGILEDQKLAFLSRHGMGHHLSPTEVNYRANIWALKKLGVERAISVNACGSLREDYEPGDLVVPHQLFDFTKNRTYTFFGDGLVAHIGTADPFCEELSSHLVEAVKSTGATVHPQGAFITIEGPRFSTKVESNTFRTWGMSIIGMTTAPEAFLAREAELCYASLAHITDYDVWHTSEEPVTVEMVMNILQQNTENIKKTIQYLAENPLSSERSCDCSQALKNAIITDPDVIPEKTQTKLGLLVSKYL